MIKNHFPFDDQGPDDAQILNDIQQNQAICLALSKLQEANDSAMACGRDPWDFAVELSELSDCGVGTHILRMMICRMWITHMREIPNPSERHRAYEPEIDLVLSDHSCFVLTQKGLDIARKLAATETKLKEKSESSGDVPNRQVTSNHTDENTAPTPAPCWDRERRELRMGKVVVKRFKWPAENQEQVLDAFQEEGWPSHIDDPLVPNAKICPKRRLHDTLKCLNRKQVNEVIKFRGDGTGQGVLLEINWPDRQE